jgi:hypothetical protein
MDLESISTTCSALNWNLATRKYVPLVSLLPNRVRFSHNVDNDLLAWRLEFLWNVDITKDNVEREIIDRKPLDVRNTLATWQRQHDFFIEVPKGHLTFQRVIPTPAILLAMPL